MDVTPALTKLDVHVKFGDDRASNCLWLYFLRLNLTALKTVDLRFSWLTGEQDELDVYLSTAAAGNPIRSDGYTCHYSRLVQGLRALYVHPGLEKSGSHNLDMQFSVMIEGFVTVDSDPPWLLQESDVQTLQINNSIIGTGLFTKLIRARRELSN